LHAPASRRGDHREPPTALLRNLKRERRAKGASGRCTEGASDRRSIAQSHPLHSAHAEWSKVHIYSCVDPELRAPETIRAATHAHCTC
jgi:hypothetical protein